MHGLPDESNAYLQSSPGETRGHNDLALISKLNSKIQIIVGRLQQYQMLYQVVVEVWDIKKIFYFWWQIKFWAGNFSLRVGKLGYLSKRNFFRGQKRWNSRLSLHNGLIYFPKYIWPLPYMHFTCLFAISKDSLIFFSKARQQNFYMH